MLSAQFRPLKEWPGKRMGSGKIASFRSTYPRTLDDLEFELAKLKARDVIIQVDNLAPGDIRNDGWPKGSWCPRGGTSTGCAPRRR